MNRTGIFMALSLALTASCKSKSPSPVAQNEHAEEGHEEHGQDGHNEHRDEGHEEIIVLSPEAARRARIAVAPVENRPVSAVLATTGRVGFDENRVAQVSPRVPGRVHEVKAVLGDTVKQGQPLAILDSIELGEAKSQFQRAQTQAALAGQTLEREEGLLADRITTEAAVQQARAAHQSAQADLRAARERLRLVGLSDAEIRSVGNANRSASMFALRSPLAGTVVEKKTNLGEMATPEQALYTVADLSRLWIWIDVFERDLSRIHLEDDVTVKVEAYPDKVFEGKVGYIRDTVDPDTRTARARIDVPNPEGILKPGMFASVTVTDPHGVGGAKAPPVLAIPAAALQMAGDKTIVFVPVGENRYERREVIVGVRTDEWAEILEGLIPSDTVVTDGAFLLKSEAAKGEMGGGHSH